MGRTPAHINWLLTTSWNGMEYAIWAKGPALGPVRSFSADRRRREKKK